MLEPRTYAITELVQLSGFDRRTIVYYLQQGLLPRAGRRGPNTRYPEESLVRLRFIRGLKEHQDQGRSSTITLADIRRILDRLDLPRMRALLEQHLPLDEIRPLLQPESPAEPPREAPPPPAEAATAPPAGGPPPAPAPARPSLFQRPAVGDGRSYGLADAGIRNRMARPATTPENPTVQGGAPPPAAPPPRPGEPPPTPQEAAEIERSLGEMLRDLELRPSLTQKRLAPGAAEQWTEIPITSRVFLSVRGLSENDAPLADAVGRALKKLLRAR